MRVRGKLISTGPLFNRRWQFQILIAPKWSDLVISPWPRENTHANSQCEEQRKSNENRELIGRWKRGLPLGRIFRKTTN